MWKILVIATCLFTVCGPASALEFNPPQPSIGPLIQQSHMPLPPGTVTLSHDTAQCSKAAFACEDAVTSTIYMPLITYSNAPMWHVALFHELGHIYDAEILTPETRALFQIMVHMPGIWTLPQDQRSPAEIFAQAYSVCARHLTLHGRVTYVIYGYNPTPKQHARICAFIGSTASKTVVPAAVPLA